MTRDRDDQNLDAIVGAALKLFIEGGADRARIGAFAAQFREEVSEILGLSAAKPAEPDLLAMISQTVRQAMLDPTINRAATSRGAPKKRIYVNVGGKQTSVSLPADAIAKLTEVTGAWKSSKAIIQQLAQSAPSGVENRSLWIEGRMLAAATQQPSADSPRH